MASTDDGEPAETLAEAFSALARQLRQASAESLAGWGVTPSQARVLRVLARHGTMRLSVLAGHLHIAARSATEVVDGLEFEGLLARRPDAGDRRATLVCLTDQGTATAHGIRASRATEADRLFDRLDARDRAELARILGDLRVRAELDRPGGT